MKQFRIFRSARHALMILAAIFAVTPAMQAAFTYTSESALAKGRWVKVKVTTTGINQITDEELRAMGFTNPEKVSVFGYPATNLSNNLLKAALPDDLPQVPAIHTNGKLLFYAQNDVTTKMVRELIYNDIVTYAQSQTNHYADHSCYFLTDSRTPLQPVSTPYTPHTGTPLSTSWGVMHYEKNVQIPGTMGAFALDRDFAEEPTQTYNFTLPGYNGGKMTLQFRFGIAVTDNATMSIKLSDNLTLGNSILKTNGGETYHYRDNVFTYTTSNLPVAADGRYSATADMTKYLSSHNVTSVGGLDYFTALYPRDNAMNGAPQQTMIFSAITPTNDVKITGADKDIYFWDITTPEVPRALEAAEAPEGDGMLVNSPGNYNIIYNTGCAYIVAFDPKATHPTPENMGEVASQNLHSLQAPHMLIVAARDFMPQAERLAALHREIDGIDVAVVMQDDVYNEFSSGAPSPMAIRRFAKMLYDKNPSKFRSLLLFAPAHYDLKAVTQTDPQAFRNTYIPLFTCEDFAKAGHQSHSFATDSYYGTLGENTSSFRVLREQMTINVGRIAAQNPADAESYINKIEKYLRTPPETDFVNRAAIVADAGDSNSHLRDAEKMASTINANTNVVTCYKSYSTLFPKKGTLAQGTTDHLRGVLSKGVSFWSYNGHSGPMNIGSGAIWNVDKVNAYDYDVPPFTVFASCRTAYIDHPESNLANALTTKENGGSIAVVGALREVYQVHNLTFCNFVTDEYFSVPAGSTLGDVFRNAHNRAFAQAAALLSDQLAENTHCYNLVGDPELKVPRGTYSAAFSQVDGETFDTSATVTLVPGATTSVTGKITSNGTVAADFNGEIFIAIYDGTREISLPNGDDPSLDPDIVSLDESLVYEKLLPVSNGVFSGDIFIPVVTAPSKANRITFYAVTTDGTRKATGMHGNIVIADITQPIETSGENIPVITTMYLDSESFAEGDVVSGNVTLHAEIAENAVGVAGTSAVPGKALVVSLDNGAKTYSMASGYFKPDTNGGGVLDFPVDALSDGPHTLTLRVSNYAGQTAQRTISFTVHNEGAVTNLTVDEYPASTQATINLSHNFSLEPSARLVIKNGIGEIVFHTPQATFPFTWNLTDNNGNPVAEGVYTAEAYLTDNSRFAITPKLEIIVNRD